MKTVTPFCHGPVRGFKFGSNFFGAPRMFSHIYFVDGLLIDTGHSNMRREILATIGDLSAEQIFITHHHEDHTGNLAEAQTHFCCQTFASSRCVEMMKKPPNISFAQWLTWGDRPNNHHIVAEDQRISTAQHNFEIIALPGHAVDMVGLYEPNEGWFFSADLWVSSHIRYFMRAESMRQQIESIRRALELDFGVLFCGHRPQFSDGKSKLEKKLQFFEDYYGKVAELHHRGLAPRAIMRELGIAESRQIWLLSGGALSTLNMVKSVVRDEERGEK